MTLRSLAFAAAFLVTLGGCPAGSAAETYILRMGSGHPAGPSVYATMMQSWLAPEIARRVAEQTEHEVRFVHGYGGSIAKVAETLEAVEAGVLDFGGYCICFEPAKLFLHNFAYFVPFGPEDSEMAIAIARQVYDEHPWLAAQFRERYGQELLALNAWDNYHLGTVRPWEDVADLAGVKIGGAGPNLPWLSHVGAIPVQSTLPDGYMSMQTGVYSGWLMFPSAYFAYKFHEPAPYYTLVGFGAMGGAVVITVNSATMRRLPEEVRRIIREAGADYERVAATALQERQVKGLELLRGSGAQVRTLPAAVRRRWAESLVDFPNSMAREADSRGMPGSKILRDYIETAAAFGHVWPVDYAIE